MVPRASLVPALVALVSCAAAASPPRSEPVPVAVADVGDAAVADAPPGPEIALGLSETSSAETEHVELVTTEAASLRARVYAQDPTESPVSCAKPGLRLEIAKSAEKRCPANEPCVLAVPVKIVNCGATPVVPKMLSMKRVVAGREQRTPLPYLEPLPPKHRLDGVVVELVAGERWSVAVFAEDPQTPGSFVAGTGGVIEVVDRTRADQDARDKTARAREVAACRARGGTYEMVGGLAASEECVFPFPDTGKVCHDKADCRGECLMTRAVPVGNGKVRLDGKCSRLSTTFGCHARIGHVPGRNGIVPEDEVPPSMCVD